MKLINIIREHARKRWVEDGVSSTHVVSGGTLLDPSALTIGFGRRFAAYKRADLLFQDIDRLKKLLNRQMAPLQIIFAGKAHPQMIRPRESFNEYSTLPMTFSGGRIAFVETTVSNWRSTWSMVWTYGSIIPFRPMRRAEPAA